MTRHSWRTTAIVAAAVLAASSNASAQWVVYDAATTARNTITAAVKEQLVALQIEQHDKVREMARRLSALTNLRKYATADVPRWVEHARAGVSFAGSYLDALSAGDPGGAAYPAWAQALVRSDRLAGLPPSTRRAMLSRLATIDLADAAAIASTHSTGQLRFGGRDTELAAIDALERDVIDPSLEQSTSAVLDKISGATLIGARQRQARIQLLTGVVEQLLVDSKRARDTDTAALNMQLTTWRDRRAAAEAFVAGSAHALESWRQP